jgi:uncharacterized membrane protein YraQ (UPF0718 family)
MGDVQEEELEALRGGFLIGGVLRSLISASTRAQICHRRLRLRSVYAVAIFAAPAIVAVAIIPVIRRRAENPVSQKWNAADLTTTFLAETPKWCAYR